MNSGPNPGLNSGLNQRCQEAFVFAQSKGRLLSAKENLLGPKGGWFADRVVPMDSPPKEDIQTFLQGLEHQAMSQDRKAGAETVTSMRRGLSAPSPRARPAAFSLKVDSFRLPARNRTGILHISFF